MAIALSAFGASAPVLAHDTWFAPSGDRPAAGGLTLATGVHYPKQEIAIDPAAIRERGCRSADGRRATLSAVEITANALLMRAATTGKGSIESPMSCWAQLDPADIEIDDAIVALYLDEVNAPPAVRERWAQLKARGVRWKERYVKHARIELRGTSAAATDAPPSRTPMAVDAVLEGPLQGIRPGDELRFRLWRGAAPLAGLAVQLRGPAGEEGAWTRSDEQGRVRIAAPSPGWWVLRGVEIRPDPRDRDAWESDFLTLAFEVRVP